VALAGLAWAPPASAAWAARVFVNSRAARAHGVAAVGLPSRGAAFVARPAPAASGAGGAAAAPRSWWDAACPRGGGGAATHSVEVRGGGGARVALAPPAEPARRAPAPRLRLSLPSFSGCTPRVPGLLEYSLRLVTRIRFVKPVGVALPAGRRGAAGAEDGALRAVLGGRPLLCIAFDDLVMHVAAPRPSARLTGAGAAAWAL
jgi:hypothetical protein